MSSTNEKETKDQYDIMGILETNSDKTKLVKSTDKDGSPTKMFSDNEK